MAVTFASIILAFFLVVIVMNFFFQYMISSERMFPPMKCLRVHDGLKEFIPNCSERLRLVGYGEFFYSYDKNGHRKLEGESQKPDNGPRILLMGTCESLGFGGAYQDSIIFKLKENLSKAGLQANFINGGMFSNSPVMDLKKAAAIRKNIDPDIVVYYATGSDPMNSYFQKHYLGKSPVGLLPQPLLSFVYQKTYLTQVFHYLGFLTSLADARFFHTADSLADGALSALKEVEKVMTKKEPDGKSPIFLVVVRELYDTNSDGTWIDPKNENNKIGPSFYILNNDLYYFFAAKMFSGSRLAYYRKILEDSKRPENIVHLDLREHPKYEFDKMFMGSTHLSPLATDLMAEGLADALKPWIRGLGNLKK